MLKWRKRPCERCGLIYSPEHTVCDCGYQLSALQPSHIHGFRLWWRECFIANPLLTRETGIGKGRPFWKSPMRWAVLLVVIPQIFVVAKSLREHLIHWTWSPHDIASFMSVMNTIESDSLLNFLEWSAYISYIAAVIFPVWCVARAWSREGEQDSRFELGITRLSTGQLLGSKALVWVFPFVMTGLVTLALSYLTDFILSLGSGSFSAFNRVSRMGSSIGMSWAIVLTIVHHLEIVIHCAMMGVLSLGIATRFALQGWRPLLNVIVTGIFLVAWLSFLESSWYLQIQARVSMNSDISQMMENVWAMRRLYFTRPLFGLAEITFLLMVSFGVWWEMPRRVAEAYGMEK